MLFGTGAEEAVRATADRGTLEAAIDDGEGDVRRHAVTRRRCGSRRAS